MGVTTRETRFRQAALAYFLYGCLYMAGAAYLASQGIGASRIQGLTGWIAWFAMGAVFIVLFPWLIARGARGRAYLWFVRVLTVLVAVRAIRVGLLALDPATPTAPLPGGGELSMAVGAGVFFFATVTTLALLVRAAWSRPR